MPRIFESTSRIALIALLASTPLGYAAAQDTNEDGTVLEEAEDTGEQAADTAEAAGDAIAEEAEEAGDEIEQEAEEAGAEMDAAADEAEAEIEAETDGDDTMTTTTGGDMDADADASADMTTDADTMAAEGDMAEGEEAEGEEAAQPVEGQITMQGDNTILANELMGATVYNDTDETVGDINNFIINFDGTVEGVVIGVGGFLGIGEKLVAIEIDSIEVVEDENGDLRLVTSSTQEDLENAPEFVTAEEQEQEAEQNAMQNDPAATGDMGATGTATGTGMAADPAAPAAEGEMEDSQ
ncbi:hypothetical protein EKE94_09700 [Mesobaculum littorinae]|uniref:PRC-barrel domain-containing protein n=1 Tax=Mesobaculum littorinae TaxID=2486419 RepID=A0A438AGD3_9RHOB|nr:PRC-barrel domain-containing protein [Mesobaculum littorinae]RVV97754.1 hypothetical protein EKE94_09700 [Mesobaculum littorinae]